MQADMSAGRGLALFLPVLARQPGKGFAAVLASVTSILIGGIAAGQSTTSKLDPLRMQYRVVRVPVFGGMQGDGTPLIVQKEGIFGLGVHGTMNPTATYVEGALRSPTKTAALLSGGKTHWFQAGERVFPLALEIDGKSDRITLSVVTSDGAYKGSVRFQFSRGYLSLADSAQVQSVISEVLAIEAPPNERHVQAPPTRAKPIPPPPEPVPRLDPIAPPPPPPDQPAETPKTISVGDSKDQVTAVLGQPEKVARLADREIYFFKGLKVTFTEGKVSNIE
jgi:hypothetical protein